MPKNSIILVSNFTIGLKSINTQFKDFRVVKPTIPTRKSDNVFPNTEVNRSFAALLWAMKKSATNKYSLQLLSSNAKCMLRNKLSKEYCKGRRNKCQSCFLQTVTAATNQNLVYIWWAMFWKSYLDSDFHAKGIKHTDTRQNKPIRNKKLRNNMIIALRLSGF